MGSWSYLGAATSSIIGSSMGSKWISSPLLTFRSCRRTAYLATVFIKGCRSISALVPSLPPSLALVCAELFYIFSFLSSSWHCADFISSFLTIAEVLPLSVMSSSLGQQCVCLGGCWRWLCQIWKKLSAAFHGSHPCNPQQYQNFATQTQYSHQAQVFLFLTVLLN